MGSHGAEESKKAKKRNSKKRCFIYSSCVFFFSSSLLSFHPHTALRPTLSLPSSGNHRITTAVLLKKERPRKERHKKKKVSQKLLSFFLFPSFSNLLDLVERVVVGLHAGVVGLLEADDDGVQHGARLVDGDDLAGVVEPVALGAEDLDL